MDEKRDDVFLSGSDSTLFKSKRPSPTQCDSCSTENFISTYRRYQLAQWEIPTNKVCAVLTDNGSNMLADFHTQCKESKDLHDGNETDSYESSDEYSDKSEFDPMMADFEERERDHEVAFTNYR